MNKKMDYTNEEQIISDYWLNIPICFRKNLKLEFNRDNSEKFLAHIDMLKTKLSLNQFYLQQVHIKKQDAYFVNSLLAHTFGHELAHLNDHYFYKTAFAFFSEKLSFISKVNEAHADFYGGYIFDIKQEDLVNVMEYKRLFSSNCVHKTHPSWDERIRYINMGKYDKNLVNKIADDCHYKNEITIKQVQAFYKEIILK